MAKMPLPPPIKQNEQHMAPAALTPHLAALLTAGHLGHAYIFAGKEAFPQALALAQALLCHNPQAGYACGLCPACKKVAEYCHADCQIYTPEKNVHRIEAMRRLQAAAYLKPYEGGRKIIILEGAELLQEEAANSLLKLLEEPPADTVFILVCANWDRLLPTIKSRCQLFLFGSDNSVVLDEALVQENMAQAEALLKRLPRQALWQALQENKRDDLDREGWLHYFCALWRLTAAVAKGENNNLPLNQENALKAALLLENVLDMLRRNINQKLLIDIVFLRLWSYVSRA